MGHGLLIVHVCFRHIEKEAAKVHFYFGLDVLAVVGGGLAYEL